MRREVASCGSVSVDGAQESWGHPYEQERLNTAMPQYLEAIANAGKLLMGRLMTVIRAHRRGPWYAHAQDCQPFDQSEEEE